MSEDRLAPTRQRVSRTVFAALSPIVLMMVAIPLVRSAVESHQRPPLEADRNVFNMGRVLSGTEGVAVFRLHNRSDRPIKLAPPTVSCACVRTTAPPIILPGQSAELRAEVPFSGTHGKVEETLELFIEGYPRPMVLKIFAESVDPIPNPGAKSAKKTNPKNAAKKVDKFLRSR